MLRNAPFPKGTGPLRPEFHFLAWAKKGGRGGRHFDSPNEAKLGQAQGVVNNHLRVGERAGNLD